MIEYDDEGIAREIDRRSAEMKWNAERTLIVTRILGWYRDHPDARIEYEDGRPGEGMRRMIEDVAEEAATTGRDVLSSFGAAHCLLCDVVPGFRPVLLSAWDRTVRE